jgi:uncharacterized membrane protein
MLAVVEARMRVQAVLVAVEMLLLTTLVRHRLRELPTQEEVEAVEMVMAQMVALVLSFFPFQQHDTQVQPQAHQLSQQVAQTQF